MMSTFLSQPSHAAPTERAGPWLCHIAQAVVTARGPDAQDLLQRLGTQDLNALAERGTLPSLFVTHQGRLVANTRIVRHADTLWLVTDAGQGQMLREWLEKYTVTEDAAFAVLAEHWPMWRLLAAPPALGQPAHAEGLDRALAALAPLAPVTLRPPSGWGQGFDLLIGADKQPDASAALAAMAVTPATPAESEFARLCVGEPALGRDHDPLAPPLEWRMGQQSISWTKGCFVGQEVLSRLDSFDKVARLTMGVQSVHGAEALAALAAGTSSVRLQRDGAVIGRLASVAARPGHPDAFVALALVKREAAKEGPATVTVPDDSLEAFDVSLVHRPFWGP